MNKRFRMALFSIMIVGAVLWALSWWILPGFAKPAAGVLYASPNGLASGACDSWSNACELQTALRLATAGEEVWAQQGVYKPTSGTDRTISFELKNSVALYGGFAGAETAREQRDWAANVTVLSGDIDGNDLTDPTGVITNTANIIGTNSYHLVTSSGVTETAVLDGFFITAGQANGTGPSEEVCNGHYCGGGMYNDHSSPTLTNITFSGNSADHFAGGMYNTYSSPMLNTVIFRSNTSVAGDGGGMYNSESSPALTNVAFYDNRAQFFGGGMGNGGDNHSTLTNVTFSNNQATYGGGMSNNWLSNPTLNNVTFDGNVGWADGGGMYNFNQSSPTLTDVVFSDNYSSGGGGGMNNFWDCNASLANVSFRDNRANTGSGMYNYYSDVVLTQVLFSGNQGVNGGAMHNFQSNVTLTNISMAGNLATGQGGGIYNDGSDPYIQNALIWGNQSGSGGDNLFNGANSTPTIRYSLVGGCNPGDVWDSACGTDGGHNLPDADPLFVAPTAGNYRLQEASPAINMGDNAADLDNPSGLGTDTISSIFSDLDGNPRFVHVFVDLGAYENQTFHCPAGGVLYVDQDAAGAQTGASWTDALTTLQDALQVTDVCEIWVKEGVYYPDQGGSQAEDDRGAAFQLKTGVALYGGFAGTETTRDQRNWGSNITVLSGDIDDNDLTDPTGVITTTTAITGTNSYTVVSASSTDSSALLDGFSITGAWPMPVNWSTGGGMYTLYSNSTLANLIFSGNQATFGGGMYNNHSSPSLANVTFSGNQASEGGGMYNASSSPLVVNVTFLGNRADSGGGMHNWGSFPTIINVAFMNNQAGLGGGGMYNFMSDPVLINTTFSRNQASSGGGIHNFWNSNPRLQNSILWGNSGLQVYNDNITVPESPSIPVFTYSLVQGCYPDEVWSTDCGTDGGNNLPDAAPLFVGAAGGDLRLLPGSPAIDAGNNYSITVTTDLAGGPRFVDIPAAPDTGLGTSPLVDLGAYEANFVDVGLVKTVSPLEAVPGQPITYTLTFSNGGSLPAVGVVITDAVPSFLTIQGVDFGGVAITDTGQLSPYAWAVQTLAAGQGGVITLTATLSEPLTAGVYTNTASIAATEDAGAGNNRSDVGLHVLNVAPLAVDDSYNTLEDTPLYVTPDSVLANDSDDNGDALTAILDNDPGHGLLALNPNGSFIYTPTLNTNGSDNFTYRTYDGGLNSNIATVNLSITSVNDAPAGTNQTLTTLEEVSYTFSALDFGFTDPHDNPANSFNRVQIATLPGQGTLRLNGTVVTVGQFVTAADITAGKFIFSPVANANGAPYASLTFQVEDDGGTANNGANLDSIPNNLTIEVTPVNDAPLAVGESFIAYQNTTLLVNMPGLLANDVDVDTSKDELSTIPDNNPEHGQLLIYPDGTFLYTPASGYFGVDSFTYHVTDGELNSNVVTVTIDVYLRLFLPQINR